MGPSPGRSWWVNKWVRRWMARRIRPSRKKKEKLQHYNKVKQHRKAKAIATKIRRYKLFLLDLIRKKRAQEGISPQKALRK